MCFICEIYLPVSQTTEYFVLPNFAYVLPDGTHAPTLSSVAWCEHCGQFVPAEIIPSFQILDKWINSASTPPYSFEVKFVANGNEDARKRIVYQNQKSKVWLGLRKSPPKCLECGSEEFEYIPDKCSDSPARIDSPLLVSTMFGQTAIDHIVYLLDVEGNRIGETTRESIDE